MRVIAIPEATARLFAPADLASWPAEDLLEVAQFVASLFVGSLKGQSMVAVGERYRHHTDRAKHDFIDPAAVVYDPELGPRTKVLELATLEQTFGAANYRRKALLLAAGGRYVVETMHASVICNPDDPEHICFPEVPAEVRFDDQAIGQALVTDVGLLARILIQLDECAGFTEDAVRARLDDCIKSREALRSILDRLPR